MLINSISLEPSRKSHIIFTIAALFVLWCISFLADILFATIYNTFYSCLFDDAMISMRYAWNLANGNGLVWNPGEYVQGYSNMLMTLFMTLIHLVFNKQFAVMAVNISGIVFMLLIAIATRGITKYMYPDASEKENNIASIAAFAMILCYYPLAYFSLMGMETGMLAALLTFGVLYIFKYERSCNIKHLYLATLFLSLALLTRTESAIFSALIGTYTLLLLRQKKYQKHLPHFIVATILYNSTGIGLLLFQYSYYGEWLPNTYTLKLTGMPLYHRMINGVSYITSFLLSMLFIFACIAADMIRGYNNKKILACAIIISAILYNIYIGGDVWPYYRITAPIMPLAISLFVISIVRAMRVEQLHRVISDNNISQAKINKMRARRTFVATWMIVGILMANYQFMGEWLRLEEPYLTKYYKSDTNKALILDKVLTKEATIGVTAAGIIPYYTGRIGIDFLGKMDKYIANLEPDLTGAASLYSTNSTPGHNKYDLDYSIKQKRPEYIEFYQWGQDDLTELAMQNYYQIITRYGHIHILKDSTKINLGKLNEYFRYEQAWPAHAYMPYKDDSEVTPILYNPWGK